MDPDARRRALAPFVLLAVAVVAGAPPDAGRGGAGAPTRQRILVKAAAGAFVVAVALMAVLMVLERSAPRVRADAG